MQETTISYSLILEKIPSVTKANIHFATQQKCKVMIKVLHQNEEVRLLMNETVSEGKHTVALDYSHLPSETYSIKLIAETETSIDRETIIVQL